MTPEEPKQEINMTPEELKQEILDTWPEKLIGGEMKDVHKGQMYWCSLGYCQYVASSHDLGLLDRTDLTDQNDENYTSFLPTKVRAKGMKKYFEKHIDISLINGVLILEQRD